jgi:prevent-host-death family protein
MQTVSVAKVKSHLSELLAKSAHNKEKFIITRRNKPIAALVSMEDLRIIEQHQERSGLIAVAGKWQGFEEVAEFVEDIESLRLNGGMGRDVFI